MNDNFESNIPFERAFKRLRVDTNELPNDDSNDNLIRNNSNSLTNNNVPCTSSSTFWRETDKAKFDKSYNNNNQALFDKTSSNQLNTFDHSAKLNNRTSNKSNQYIRPAHFEPQISPGTMLKNKDDLKSKCNFLINDLKNPNIKSLSNSELAQNCSHQARNESDITVDELAGYLDVQLYLPKKMSFMAELAYS